MLAQCFAWSNGDDEFLEGFLKHYQKSPELRRHLGIRGGEFLGMLEPQVTERLGAKAAQLRELFAAQKPNGCAAVFGRRFAY